MWGRKLATIVIAVMLAFAAAACGSGDGGGSGSSGSGSSGGSGGSGGASSGGGGQSGGGGSAPAKTTVDFWYLWVGVEGEYVEKLIAEFNASQDLYEVKGLSVPDEQKITVAISSGEGPDITDSFSDRTAGFAAQGMLLALDEYIARDGFDLSDFVPAALEHNRYDGKLYALPINVNFFQLFYNKALLAEAGYSEPPKSASELLEYAVKLTKVNADGTIDTIGFPEFPVVYYTTNIAYALGGDFISADGSTLTPDNDGMLAAIKLMQEYRNRFGVDNVIKFNSSAKYLDATDPFIMGKQALRIDGPWFGHTIKNVLQKDIDYGVAPLPGPDGNPGYGGGEVSSSTFFIPSNAKNKEGAWAFMSWLMSKESMTKFNDMFANLPARTSIYGDPSLQDIPDFAAFAKAAASPNLKAFPAFDAQAEYKKAISDEFELAVNGRKSAEEAVQAMKSKSAGLLK